MGTYTHAGGLINIPDATITMDYLAHLVVNVIMSDGLPKGHPMYHGPLNQPPHLPRHQPVKQDLALRGELHTEKKARATTGAISSCTARDKASPLCQGASSTARGRGAEGAGGWAGWGVGDLRSYVADSTQQTNASKHKGLKTRLRCPQYAGRGEGH